MGVPIIITIDDVTRLGIPSTAYGTLTADQKQGAVDSANAEALNRLGGRYKQINRDGGGGWTIADAAVKYHTVSIAQFMALDTRGRAVPNDARIDRRYDRALVFFDEVERQKRHPNIYGGETPGNTAQGPRLVSSSAAWAGSGRTNGNRGI